MDIRFHQLATQVKASMQWHKNDDSNLLQVDFLSCGSFVKPEKRDNLPFHLHLGNVLQWVCFLNDVLARGNQSNWYTGMVPNIRYV